MVAFQGKAPLTHIISKVYNRFNKDQIQTVCYDLDVMIKIISLTNIIFLLPVSLK